MAFLETNNSECWWFGPWWTFMGQTIAPRVHYSPWAGPHCHFGKTLIHYVWRWTQTALKPSYQWSIITHLMIPNLRWGYGKTTYLSPVKGEAHDMNGSNASMGYMKRTSRNWTAFVFYWHFECLEKASMRLTSNSHPRALYFYVQESISYAIEICTPSLD